MSVGVCIINRNGIALAADSAGTFGGHQMFYNSVNKLFSLSNKFSYGAIIYNNLNIHQTSLEQIICEFRAFLDSQEELEDFFEISDLFKSFLEDRNDYYRFPQAEREYCEGLIKQIVVDWKQKLLLALQQKKALPINNAINGIKEFYEKVPKIQGSSLQKYIFENYRSSYDSILNQEIPEFVSHKKQVNAFWRVISDYFDRAGPLNSGVFFAGYGKNDAYPKYVHIHIYAVLCGEARIWQEERYAQENSCKIVSLAQTDVILTFCQGISGSLMNQIPDMIDKHFDMEIDSYGGSDEGRKALRAFFSDCQGAVRGVLDKVVKQEVIRTLAFLSVLPIPEMASFAENLVNITTLKRTYAIDGNQQTVGGPTDVAVISKGQGFEWIRKDSKYR